jgi:MFS family permease
LKQIYVAYAIASCSMLPMRASRVLLSLFALELGAGISVIGLLVASVSIMPAFLSIFAGRLSDRLGIRLPMIFGGAGVTVAMAIPYFMPNLTGLFISALLLGATHIFFGVSLQHWIGQFGTHAEERTKNFGNYSVAVSLGGFAGPIIAGFGIDHLGHASAYLVCMLFPLASFFAVWLLARDLRTPKKGGDAPAARNTMDLLRQPGLRRVLVTGGILLTGIDLFEFYMPVYSRGIHLSASAIGMIVGTYAIAALVIRTAIPRLLRWKNEEQLLTLCLGLGACVYLLVPFVQNPWILGALAFALGLCMGCGQPLTMSIIYNRSPEGRAGEALGVRLTTNSITHASVPVIFGGLGAAIGVSPVFWAIAALLFAGSWYSAPGRERKPSPPA